MTLIQPRSRAAAAALAGVASAEASSASAPLLVALSAHAFARDPRWLARLLACFEDERVAAASGEIFDWDNTPLAAPRVQDLELARHNPYWGYSNAAGGFRRDLWKQHQ